MWTKELVGTDVYHLVFCFIIYSIIGWLMESTYMSICNKKITNRGFGICPFCPIYGFGGLLGYFLLHSLVNNSVFLYVAGAIIATLFELIVAKLMLRFFDLVWWDYNNKPFNYKGIICLESTIAWGFYAVIIVKYLHFQVLSLIDKVTVEMGMRFCKLVIIVYGFDFIFHVLCALGINMSKYRERIMEQYNEIRTRF